MDAAIWEPTQPLLGTPCARLLPLPTVHTVCRKGPESPCLDAVPPPPPSQRAGAASLMLECGAARWPASYLRGFLIKGS